jgi:hypothetical protein
MAWNGTINLFVVLFGLLMHVGSPGKKSKTEAMYCPARVSAYGDGGTSGMVLDCGGSGESALPSPTSTSARSFTATFLIITTWMHESRKPPKPLARFCRQVRQSDHPHKFATKEENLSPTHWQTPAIFSFVPYGRGGGTLRASDRGWSALPSVFSSRDVPERLKGEVYAGGALAVLLCGFES